MSSSNAHLAQFAQRGEPGIPLTALLRVPQVRALLLSTEGYRATALDLATTVTLRLRSNVPLESGDAVLEVSDITSAPGFALKGLRFERNGSVCPDAIEQEGRGLFVVRLPAWTAEGRWMLRLVKALIPSA